MLRTPEAAATLRAARRRWQCALALVAALAACGGGKPPPIAPLAADATILAFGDSLTWGTGAKRGQDYPAQLAALTGRKVVNAGVPGETTPDGRARLPDVLDENDPALVILCLGGNDMLNQRDRGAMRANLKAMIEEIRGRGIPVVLLGVPEPKLLGLSSEPSYATLAGEFGLAAELKIIPEVLSDRARKSDTIHPNATGYHDMAEAIAQLLRDAGAIQEN